MYREKRVIDVMDTVLVPQSRWRFLILIDILAFFAIVQSYWAIDIAAFAPQLIGPPTWPWHYGLYWYLAYIQGMVGAFWLVGRSVWRAVK